MRKQCKIVENVCGFKEINCCVEYIWRRIGIPGCGTCKLISAPKTPQNKSMMDEGYTTQCKSLRNIAVLYNVVATTRLCFV